MPVGPVAAEAVSGRRALPCLTKVFTSAGCRIGVGPSGSSTTGSDIPQTRRDLVGPIRPRPMGTSTRQPDLGVWQNRPGRVTGAAPRASEMAHGSLPTNATAPSGGGPRSEKACGSPHRTDPSLRFGTRPRQRPRPSGWRQPPSQSPPSRLNQEDVHPAHCSPRKNWVESTARGNERRRAGSFGSGQRCTVKQPGAGHACCIDARRELWPVG